ncbi:MAG: MotA/TolQ/ExbB proton channel family protein, partial [Planctomycetales bacterium]|nr:MotA/TolQ/ExbB proton channel family protein [Planctomycetales bacterium]
MKPQKQPSSFSVPMHGSVVFGSILATVFYGLIYAGPLDFELLRRYCMSHPVAIASVFLFFVGMVALGIKWFRVVVQVSLTHTVSALVTRLVTEGEDVLPKQRPQWLLANLQAQTANLKHSWLCARIISVVQLQIQRGRQHELERDLQAASSSDADRQHESYGLLRIITWAMPMLGFLGTVLGISQTLGQLDTQLLATQQQEAMNQLTAGLYVAFDTTAIALVLTVFSMFVQFAVGRIEMSLLTRMDMACTNCLLGFLSTDPYETQSTLLIPVREMTSELIGTVRDLVREQAAIWARSMAESQKQWSEFASGVSSNIEDQLSVRMSQTLEVHLEGLKRLHDEGFRQVEARWQQWQTTLSDHARNVQNQQKEIARLADSLLKMANATTEIQRLESTIHESVGRLENIKRIEEATLCVGEAVAVLGTSLERAGILR